MVKNFRMKGCDRLQILKYTLYSSNLMQEQQEVDITQLKLPITFSFSYIGTNHSGLYNIEAIVGKKWILQYVTLNTFTFSYRYIAYPDIKIK